MMGDEEAVASAYSLYDYCVAESLGGEAAYDDLRTRAYDHGIRLSTDMVPNHMGIDSRWMIEHPHWFLWRDAPPFPTYSFDGPDLCDDERVGVYIEDHYWQRDDAAVVFKRVDHHTGEARFVYHGNDGTSMPWNDTAQLDYLNPEVREAVIQTILAVARRSPVIRFDAAMTLARQHYHRLWFPAPGAAGAIPSRAEYSLTRPEFDSAMPTEFWREVVDRVAEEAPDTLLLAEAFWLLEGYFVRTLGMHRVYNSAFMNMLRDEKNDEYRKLIRSTLEFDPQILKRYVNFMSNPDERTAVDQFGTGDKYFGVATLLATMPGLPMLGHGQIEGLSEKYGMEFQRPRWDERPNEGLVWRHELQIFPLLRRRAIFAEVENFLLYDMVREDSSVDENVFAYSNRVDGERSLVIYNNRYGETSGTLRLSTAVVRRDEAGNTDLVLTALADGLGLPDDDSWVVARDVVTGLEHLWSSRRLRDEGLPCRLRAYGLHCFLDFKTVYSDGERPFDQLAERIGDRGVPSIDSALGQWLMAPVVEPLRCLTPPELLELLASDASFGAAADELRELAVIEVARLAEAAAERVATPEAARGVERSIHIDLEAALALGGIERAVDAIDAENVSPPLAPAPSSSEEWLLVIGWIVARHLGSLDGEREALERSRSLFEQWYLRAAVGDRLHEIGLPQETAQRHAAIIDLLLAADGWDSATDNLDESFGAALRSILNTAGGQRRLGVNRYGGELWFNGEAFELLAAGLAMTAAVSAVRSGGAEVEARLRSILECVERGREAASESGFRLAELLELLAGSDTSGSPER
jgi:glycosidase